MTEKILSSKAIRQAFLDFFASKDHHIVPSAPMVIKDDPTLMFTNAGMNPFKDIILGTSPIKYPRVADAQKCLRVSGKHNDLEEVGHDTYHHTMFEMLGNWSFGDYFKKEAIHWAWEFLTEVLGLDPSIFYVTVFEGAPSEGLERDQEAAKYWAEILPEERILNGNKKDNFWEMGDTGPCGPCSEIHMDLRSTEEKAKQPGTELVNKDHPEVIEVWNLVFMQYSRKADGSLEPLPKKVIDTGMGFERLCRVMQGKSSNYDTDVFSPIIEKIATDCGIAYGKAQETDVAMRVLADHVRTIAFSITDGQLPSNAKAGYVIRRILRRAVRYAYTFLNLKQAYIYKLIPVLIQQMGEAYPELKAQQKLISRVVKEEEESFLRTLETGIHMLESYIKTLKEKGQKQLEGRKVFELYDTYGFPVDLTLLILGENGLDGDTDGFAKAMAEQKSRARQAAVVDAADWVILSEATPEFTGYDNLKESKARVLRYRQVKKKAKSFYHLVFDKSPFYAEMGGQVGDSGLAISLETHAAYPILDVIHENKLPIHIFSELPEPVEAGFSLEVDLKKRVATEINHTATHLLHEALRDVLGKHVEQKGSLVSPEVLRFDFSHFSKMTPEEIRRVEELVTSRIRADYPREEFRNIPIAEAKAMGAMALFGEKYGDEVRVIKYGDSIELCGGTHLTSTGKIGTFRIISESSIAAGVRRVEAVAGQLAEDYLYSFQDTVSEIRTMLNNAPNLKQALRKLLEEDEQLRKELKAAAEASKKRILNEMRKQEHPVINGVKVIRPAVLLKADTAKDLAFILKSELDTQSFVFVAGSAEDDKCVLTLMLGDTLVNSGANAGQLVREAAKHIKGGGGGQPSFATAGGKQPAGLDDAIDDILEKLKLKP